MAVLQNQKHSSSSDPPPPSKVQSPCFSLRYVYGFACKQSMWLFCLQMVLQSNRGRLPKNKEKLFSKKYSRITQSQMTKSTVRNTVLSSLFPSFFVSWVLFIHICIGFLFLFLISSILNCMEFEIIESAQKLTLLFSSFKLWVLLLFFPGKPNSLIKFLYLFVSIFSLHCQ